jgi:hypothetical protein
MPGACLWRLDRLTAAGFEFEIIDFSKSRRFKTPEAQW